MFLRSIACFQWQKDKGRCRSYTLKVVHQQWPYLNGKIKFLINICTFKTQCKHQQYKKYAARRRKSTNKKKSKTPQTLRSKSKQIHTRCTKIDICTHSAHNLEQNHVFFVHIPSHAQPTTKINSFSTAFSHRLHCPCRTFNLKKAHFQKSSSRIQNASLHAKTLLFGTLALSWDKTCRGRNLYSASPTLIWARHIHTFGDRNTFDSTFGNTGTRTNTFGNAHTFASLTLVQTLLVIQTLVQTLCKYRHTLCKVPPSYATHKIVYLCTHKY